MEAIAVKVTEVPAHTAPLASDEIVTSGTTVGKRETVMLLLVDVAGKAHTLLLVITQVTTSPLLKEELLNVLLFVP